MTTDLDDRDADLAILKQLRKRIADPGIGNEAFTRLSNEIRQLEKKLRRDDGGLPVESVTVDAARQAFEQEFGPVDAELFDRIRDEAVNQRLMPRTRGRGSQGSSSEWWRQFAATPLAVLQYRRAARRLEISL